MRERGGVEGRESGCRVEEEELPNRLSISLSWADVFKGRLEILRKFNYLGDDPDYRLRNIHIEPYDQSLTPPLVDQKLPILTLKMYTS